MLLSLSLSLSLSPGQQDMGGCLSQQHQRVQHNFGRHAPPCRRLGVVAGDRNGPVSSLFRQASGLGQVKLGQFRLG